MADSRTICVLGGVYHPFEEAESFFGQRLPSVDCTVRCTWDPNVLGAISMEDTDLVILYTCYGDYDLPEMAAENLAAFVAAGGGLLALHGATSSFRSSRAYHALIGATFVEHGPRHNFTVMPMQWSHPVTQDVGAFTVNDELYVQEYDFGGGMEIHMVAAYLNRIQPMVWTRVYGEGRICYIAMGHDRAVWEHPQIWQLTRNAIAWCASRSARDSEESQVSARSRRMNQQTH